MNDNFTSWIENKSSETNYDEKTTIGPLLCENKLTIEDRSIGILLSAMIGDALGAAVEGYGADEIQLEFPFGIQKYYSRPHMGIPHLGPRFAMYTDDTQSAFALASSIVDKKELNGEHVARNYSLFFRHEPLRGYPSSAQRVLNLLFSQTISYTQSGTLLFKDGSYANGGAMRISPLAIPFREEDDQTLRKAVFTAIRSTHVHPYALEGAYIQAKGVSILLKENAENFDINLFLTQLKSLSLIEEYKERIEIIQSNYTKMKIEIDLSNQDECLNEYNQQKEIIKEITNDEFQLLAIDAIAITLWAFSLYWKYPAIAITKIIGYGGDTDTIASLLGALLGALHGTHWIPSRWFVPLEDQTPWGKSFAVSIAKQLSFLTLNSSNIVD